jgi:L,D-peptidoglycan transpeptidase YkuD (ErfK/YbiS/YcfS/YnhG family)
MSEPSTILTTTPISKALGWCDDPAYKQYNQLVQLPFAASHEKLWRDDAVYDLVLVIGHNDAPVVPGLGSAIFVHVAKEGFSPTEGCIALERSALLALLSLIKPGDQLMIG